MKKIGFFNLVFFNYPNEIESYYNFIYMRGGVIVPWKNTLEKLIKNSYYFRNEKLNLIINLEEENKANGVIFFDNDGINTIETKEFIRVDLNYENNNLTVITSVKGGFKYEFNDKILGIIELWKESYKEECNITIYTQINEQTQVGPYEMTKDYESDKFYLNLTIANLKLNKINNILNFFN